MYIITEVQINADNTAAATPVEFFTNEQQAYSRYYTILAAAAISPIFKHCVFLNTEYQPIENKIFIHEPEEE